MRYSIQTTDLIAAHMRNAFTSANRSLTLSRFLYALHNGPYGGRLYWSSRYPRLSVPSAPH